VSGVYAPQVRATPTHILLDTPATHLYSRLCIKSRADALANLPHRARWSPRKGDAALFGNETGRAKVSPPCANITSGA
jgi:hypothetical protein